MNHYNDLAIRKLEQLKKRANCFWDGVALNENQNRGMKYIYENLIAKWNWSENYDFEILF